MRSVVESWYAGIPLDAAEVAPESISPDSRVARKTNRAVDEITPVALKTLGNERGDRRPAGFAPVLICASDGAR